MTSSRDAISWLKLERYALGDLPASERDELERRLAMDELSRACLARIEADLRALPPLPNPTLRTEPRSRWWDAVRAWQFGALAACVSLLALWVAMPALPGGLQHGDSNPAATKGDGVAISLVRERNGATATGPQYFAVGDRFSVRVTCAAGERLADVVVYQGADVSFPIDAQTIACGNNVTLSGAFRLTTHEPVRVCVVVTALPYDRASIAEYVADEASSACAAIMIEP